MSKLRRSVGRILLVFVLLVAIHLSSPPTLILPPGYKPNPGARSMNNLREKPDDRIQREGVFPFASFTNRPIPLMRPGATGSVGSLYEDVCLSGSLGTVLST